METDPSDWDPLPELGAAQHPGEAADLGARPSVGVTHTTRNAQAATGDAIATVVPGPVQPTALLPLQRSARDPDGDIAGLMRAAGPRSRSATQGEPRAAVARAAAASLRSPPAGAPANADARECEPWFHALPVLEQDRLRRAWIREVAPAAAAAPAAAPPQKQQELLEWFWVAYVVFFVAAMPLMLVEGLAGFVRMAMAGCVTGMVWQMVPRTRFYCVVSAVTVYFAIVVVPRLGELSDSLFDSLVALGGAGIVGYLASLALNEELHRRPAAA